MCLRGYCFSVLSFECGVCYAAGIGVAFGRGMLLLCGCFSFVGYTALWNSCGVVLVGCRTHIPVLLPFAWDFSYCFDGKWASVFMFAFIIKFVLLM